MPLLYPDISVLPFKYKPIIPFPVVPPCLKLSAGEVEVNLAISVPPVPSKYTPTPYPVILPK